VQEIVKAAGDDERNGLALALKKGVGRHRGTHADGLNQGRVNRLVFGLRLLCKLGEKEPCQVKNSA
jgi:hypothetical protein